MTITATPELLERTRTLAYAEALKRPHKAALRLLDLRDKSIPRAAERGDEHEVARLEALMAGTEEALSEGGTYKLCKRCGRPIKNTKQPGFIHSIGPECWKKEDRR